MISRSSFSFAVDVDRYVFGRGRAVVEDDRDVDPLVDIGPRREGEPHVVAVTRVDRHVVMVDVQVVIRGPQVAHDAVARAIPLHPEGDGVLGPVVAVHGNTACAHLAGRGELQTAAVPAVDPLLSRSGERAIVAVARRVGCRRSGPVVQFPIAHQSLGDNHARGIVLLFGDLLTEPVIIILGDVAVRICNGNDIAHRVVGGYGGVVRVAQRRAQGVGHLRLPVQGVVAVAGHVAQRIGRRGEIPVGVVGVARNGAGQAPSPSGSGWILEVLRPRLS